MKGQLEKIWMFMLVSSLVCAFETHVSRKIHKDTQMTVSSKLASVCLNASKKDCLKGPEYQDPRPNENTYWVIPNKFLAGEYPGDKRDDESFTRQKIRRYLDHGVNFFLDLTEEGERNGYDQILYDEAAARQRVPEDDFPTNPQLDVEYKRIPIQDFGIPSKQTMISILDAIDDAIYVRNKTVYVHCRGGIGRAGTTVGSFLRRHGNTGEEALKEVNRLFQFSGRSRESFYSPETSAQVDFVKNWNAEYR